MFSIILAFLGGSLATILAFAASIFYIFRYSAYSHSASSTLHSQRSSSSHKNANAKALGIERQKWNFSGWIRLTPFYNDEFIVPLSVSRMLNCCTYTKPDTDHLENFYFYANISKDKLVLSDYYQGDIIGALSLTRTKIDLVPADMLNFEVFSKLFPIRLSTTRHRDLMLLSSRRKDVKQLEGKPCLYLYPCSSIDKEDIYISLLEASGYFKNSDIIPYWIPCVGSEFPNDSVWFSAMLARIYGMKNMKENIESHLFSIFEHKIRRSSDMFVSRVKLKQVELSRMPRLSKFQMISQDCESGLVFECFIDFNGTFSVSFETDFEFDAFLALINVPVSVTISFGNLSGKAQFKVKPEPSNRLWIGFYPPGPKYEVDVVPNVSNIDLRLSLLTEIIRNNLDTLIQESFTLPNMYDIGFDDEAVIDCSIDNLENKDAEEEMRIVTRTPDILRRRK